MQDTILYVISAPYFWQTMSMITSCAIFIGAIVFNGEVRTVLKGVVAIGVYALFLTLTNIIRISNQVITNYSQAYAGTVTIGFITFFYLLGMFMGVLITKKAVTKRNRLI